MKRKIIELQQEYLIVCDNKSCDYKIKNESENPDAVEIIKFLNEPCPKCGENLLTKEDYISYAKLIKSINWANKWFSWIMFFIPKKAKPNIIYVNTHKGINFSEK